MELPNQDRIRTLREKENYKYLGILVADTIKQVEIIGKIQKNIPGELESKWTKEQKNNNKKQQN